MMQNTYELSKQRLHFYKDRICLNVLGNSIQNAQQIVDAADGNVIVGVLSANYGNLEDAIADMQKYHEATRDRLSVGLGAGNPQQCYMVAQIAAKVHPAHINQVFSMVGMTRACDDQQPWINALVSPTGTPGYVNIGTGPQSSKSPKAIVPVASAIAFVKEMGGNSLKFFPMNGLQCADEYQAVAKACAEAQFALEPTGGIDLLNFEELMRIALAEGVPQIIPHVYSSIINKENGDTKIQDVEKLFSIMKKLV